MLETEGFQVEGQFLVVDLPLFWQLKEFPVAAAFLTAVVMTVLMLPAAVVSWGVPYDLRIRTDQDIFAPTF